MDRHYPREMVKDSSHTGRIRVQLYKDDGTPFNQQFPSSKSRGEEQSKYELVLYREAVDAVHW